MQGGQFEHAGRQFAGGQLAEMPLDGRAEVGDGVGDGYGFAAEVDEASLAVDAWLQPQEFTPKEDFGAGLPSRRAAGPLRLAQELLFQPGGVSGGEALCFGQRSAAGNGDASGAVRPEAQDVAARPAGAHEAEPHPAAAGHEPVLFRRVRRFGAKEPFKLHETI